MVISEVYKEGVGRLTEAGIGEAKREAAILLEEACNVNRNTLYSHPEREVGVEEYSIYVNHIKERCKRVPIQHILGKQNFMGMEFYVNKSVLVPRPDTEFVVECILEHLHDGMKILDLCTGSGCIALSLLRYSNHCSALATDLSEEALAVAYRNAEVLLKRDPEQGRDYETRIRKTEVAEPLGEDELQLLCSDLWDKIGPDLTFDRIVSNPPYIATAVIEDLEPEVKDYDPRMALDGGEDGLSFYRRIVKEAQAHLTGGGEICFEIGFDQAGAVRKLLEEENFKDITVRKDYAGQDRMVCGRKGI